MSRKGTSRKDRGSGSQPPQAGQGSGLEEPAAALAFPVVGIGASAGGVESLKELFAHLPGDPGMAFVVVMHQPPGHTSLLPQLLSEVTAMPVLMAGDGMQVEPNRIYVAPGGTLLAILHGSLHRQEALSEEARRLPIDSFLRSLGRDQRNRAVCVILSGTGTDGTIGLKAVKAETGIAMVQEPGSAQYTGMPSSAAATGLADHVLPPAALARQLLALADAPSLIAPPEAFAIPPEPLQRILLLLRTHTGHDFSGYKPTTIGRRIERRLNVHGFRGPDAYLRFLQDHPHEIDILFRELLISVTSFFRDPEAFEALGAGPLMDLLKTRPEGQSFRIWVPGCATGEEAYSIAILVREAMAKLRVHPDVQLFGTDLDSEAIEIARLSRYPEGIAGDLTPERLERYFQRDEAGTWRLRKEIRQMCIFACHNVIRDAPFTKLDLVSCRNLLIYLDPELQKRLLRLFHYALRPGGLLFLGPSESLGDRDLYETLHPNWKIFRRCESPAGAFPVPDLALSAPDAENAVVARRDRRNSLHSPFSTLIEKLLLNWYCPAAVVVNDAGDIVHIHGRTGAYLEPAAGRPRMNLLEMAREGLQSDLRQALYQMGRERKGELVRPNLPVKSEGELIFVNLAIRRIQDPEALRGLVVVTFRSVPPPSSHVPAAEPELEPQRVEQLERELQTTKESLQTTIEELETSNQELKSTNEELQSTNEELQSTNEELETSKEEMQSLNEELTTVNAELHSKLDALAQANDDMQNLLNSTDIATIFLDNNLYIKRYTEQAKNLIKLIPRDVGRPLCDLVSNLEYEGLEEDCRHVFRTLNSREKEVRTRSGDWYLVRIIPYRTAENVIDGLVITFVDVSKVHRAGRRAQAYYEAIGSTVPEPLAILDGTHHVRCCNKLFAQLFSTTPEALEQQSFFELGGGVWNLPALRRQLEEDLTHKPQFENLEVRTRLPGDPAERVFLINGQVVECVDGCGGIVIAIAEKQ